MKQVTHTLKTGHIEVADVPVPTLTDKFVLVRTTASVISAGTEKTKIDMGHKSLLQKARSRPDLVQQVIRKLRTEGLAKTINTVNTRLGAPNPLGYSSAGVAVAVGGLVEGLKPGDRVACGGAGYANHAQFAVVPKNLVVKVPATVSDEEAAFATLGAIALQGVRLADPKLGETVLVLGLGLLGQITVQLLRANGCRVLGTDLDASLVALAEKFGATGLSVADAEIACRELTAGHGVDAVLVCAGTSSNQPIELCGRVTREKGRVVVVGAVRMDIPREDFFKKEISVVISRSYGPGRYDPDYEENGNDYPLGYVRFTEQRNMQTIIDLIAQQRLDVRSLITHRFALEDAVQAYGLIEGERREPYLGIILSYGAEVGQRHAASCAPGRGIGAGESSAHRRLCRGCWQLRHGKPAASSSRFTRRRAARPGHLQRPYSGRRRQAIRLSFLRVGTVAGTGRGHRRRTHRHPARHACTLCRAGLARGQACLCREAVGTAYGRAGADRASACRRARAPAADRFQPSLGAVDARGATPFRDRAFTARDQHPGERRLHRR